MAQNLRKDGPFVLRYLIESDLLHLVDLLISDQKWVKEYPSQKFPFKIIRPAEKGSLSSTLNSHNSNSLRSIFLDTLSPSDSKKLPEHGERNQNVSHTGVSPPAINKNLSKSRDQILADCEKLVEHVVKEYPSGFNMGGFRKLFLDRYGYYLDVQRLGYQKLVSLLQTMPRVTIESNYITPELPSGKVQKSSGVELTCNSGPQNNGGGTIAKSDSDFSATSGKYDNLDSGWEELGPVSHTSPKRNVMERSSRKLKEETIGQVNHKYETLSEEYFSGSDDVSLFSTGSEGQDKPSIKGEEISLLQILDSWHLSKEDDNTKAPMESYKRKQRPPTSYLFVSDKVVDDKKSSEMSAKSRIQA